MYDTYEANQLCLVSSLTVTDVQLYYPQYISILAVIWSSLLVERCQQHEAGIICAMHMKLEALLGGLSVYLSINIFESVPPWSSSRVLDHRSTCLNLDVGISEGCFIFDFTSLPLEIAGPMKPTMCTKVVVKHQSSSSSS